MKRNQINIRTSAYEKNMLNKNAKEKGMNLSEFVLTLAEDKTEPSQELRTRNLK